MNNTIRPPAVAGMFYSDDEVELREFVQSALQQANATQTKQHYPKAIIAPHAGYIYSGLVAASAYHYLENQKDHIHRIVLLGPSHRIPLSGCACPTVQWFSTPLGKIKLDRISIDALSEAGFVIQRDDAHAQEHSLEVHLPYIQSIFKDFTLVPIVVGEAEATDVAAILETFWDDPQTVIIVSSDLSHFLDYKSAKQQDLQTSKAIEDLDYHAIGPNDACGYYPLSGLLYIAKRKGLHATTVDLRNSGDTAGGHDRVVGYGAYVIE